MSEFTKTVVNIVTGQTVTVPMTDAEIAEVQARQAAHVVEQAAAETKAAAEASRKAKVAADLATEAKLLASIGDESTRAVIANLLARIELLEGLLGIQHAGRTGDGVKG